MLELRADDMDALRAALKDFELVDDITGEGAFLLVKVKPETEVAVLTKMLSQKGIYLTHLAQRHKSLEKHFLELVADNHA
jgi:ABC-2 type transport system ATP-binding protein